MRTLVGEAKSLISWKGKLNQPFKEEMQLRGLKFQVLGFGVYFEVSRFWFQGSSFNFFSCTHDLKDITKSVKSSSLCVWTIVNHV